MDTKPTGLKGDADNDGDVDVADVQEVLSYYAAISAGMDYMFGSNEEEHNYIFPYADVDEDGDITITDAMLILTYYSRRAAGMNPTWDELLAR